ncbi:MAG: amidohydrolase family protein, partial [Thaumarchaeota archaeon]|nr:amidohydrolase family protein [Nitrososphaerota archaeon]
SLLVHNARYVITVDSKRRIIRDGAVAVSDGEIVAVGKTDEVRRVYSSAEVKIDASRMVVTPGLVDAHFHLTEQLLRGQADGVTLPTSVSGRHWRHESFMTADDVYNSARAALLEGVKNGTTLVADPGGYHMDMVAKALDEMGVRGVLSRSLIDVLSDTSPVPEKLRETPETALAKGEEFVKEYDGKLNGRLRAWFSLRTERSTSSELARRVKEKADQLGVGIISHMTACSLWIDFHKEIFKGKRPIERYYESGVMGPNLLLLHVNWLSDEELEYVRATGTKIQHSPSTTAHAGIGGFKVGKFAEMMKKGITVCLGHDSAAESNFADIVRVMFMVTVHRDIHLDPTIFPPETILEMGTINGANCLLQDKVTGSLEVGKRADILLFDTKRPEWTPLLNPVSNLIHSACGDSVDTTIVDGKVLMQGRKLLVADENEIIEKAQKSAEEVLVRSGFEKVVRPAWPIE